MCVCVCVCVCIHTHTHTHTDTYNSCQVEILSKSPPFSCKYILCLCSKNCNTERGWHSGIARALYGRVINVNIKSTIAVMFKTFARRFNSFVPS